MVFIMIDARIYWRPKTSMQSGHAKVGEWILELERPSKQIPEPLMGWTQGGDTANQIRMEFSSQEQAETFAKSQGWRYIVSEQNKRRIKPRNYGDNFVCDMVETQ